MMRARLTRLAQYTATDGSGAILKTSTPPGFSGWQNWKLSDMDYNCTIAATYVAAQPVTSSFLTECPARPAEVSSSFAPEATEYTGGGSGAGGNGDGGNGNGGNGNGGGK